MRSCRVLMIAALSFVASLARGQWDIQTLDNPVDAGWYTSLKMVAGRPAVAYYDSANFDLKYIRANDSVGGVWGAPLTVNTPAATVGAGASMEIVGGNPAITCFGGFFAGIAYYRATNADGSAWPASPVTISPGVTVIWTSLRIVSGNPAVAYYDNSTNDLRYVRANDPNGTSWPLATLLDSSSADIGQYASMAIVAGNPAISYIDATNGTLKYIRATTATGSAWAAPVPLGTASASGSSLAVIDGNPAIAYYMSGFVAFRRATDTTGSAWAPATGPAGFATGEMLSLGVLYGNPSISYGSGTTLMLADASDAQGSAWYPPQLVDFSAAVGDYSSFIDLGSGYPAISYYDDTNGALKLARIPPPNASDQWDIYE